jgi:hypothetical protein
MIFGQNVVMPYIQAIKCDVFVINIMNIASDDKRGVSYVKASTVSKADTRIYWGILGCIINRRIYILIGSVER